MTDHLAVAETVEGPAPNNPPGKRIVLFSRARWQQLIFVAVEPVSSVNGRHGTLPFQRRQAHCLPDPMQDIRAEFELAEWIMDVLQP